MADFTLQCTAKDCGKIYQGNDGFRLACDEEKNGHHGPAMLRAEYQVEQLVYRRKLPGIFAFHDWLPVGSCYLEASSHELGRPYCYRSNGLAGRLGLENLYIAFSGYWPQRGPNLLTRSFKEFEAQGTIARYLATCGGSECRPFIISSAGNTANGFNLVSHLIGMPLYLVIPETGLDNLVLPIENNPVLIVVRGDYSDAIALADDIAAKTKLMREGGARNVARRAGMGTAMLNAVIHPEQGSGFLFDHYFQAVGSGTGAIAAWEAVLSLLQDGRFGSTRTQIHVAQNAPFTPIVDSWRAGSRELVVDSDEVAKVAIKSVTAPVLTNRHPPYSLAGGMYDVLSDSGGDAWQVDNIHVFASARMFRETEGVDIGPAAAVAVDALRQAVGQGRVRADERILLHVTGGGKEVQYSEAPVFRPIPNAFVEPGDVAGALEAIGQPETVQLPIASLREFS